MITNDGKRQIQRYLAQQVPSIAQSMAFGIGRNAPTATDKRLELEIGRTQIDSLSFDMVNNTLIFKAKIPDGLEGVIGEVALYSNEADTAPGFVEDRMLALFEDDVELWTNSPVWSNSTVRLGAQSLRQTAAASATITNQMNNLNFDLTGYSNNDVFVVAFNASANVASVRLRLKTDESNYFSWTSGSAPAAGYNILSINKSSMTATGSPNWQNIQSIEVASTATSAGSSQVDWDAVRIVDGDFTNPDYVMVARRTLTTPYVLTTGSVNEIEFKLGITL